MDHQRPLQVGRQRVADLVDDHQHVGLGQIGNTQILTGFFLAGEI